MPELPEVETVKNGLIPAMEGARLEKLILNRENLRYPFPQNMAKSIEGKTITTLSRRAKYLLIDFKDGTVLISHLGMSGSFRIESANEGGHENNNDLSVPHQHFKYARGERSKHDHVILQLNHPRHGILEVIYNDPRRFGFMDLTTRKDIENHDFFKHLGIEPLGNSLSGDFLAEKFIGKTTSMKASLLDQRIIAGLGNIYVCEALWRSKISPKRQAKTLVYANGKPKDKLNHLSGHIRDILHDAIKAGGSSLQDHKQVDGTLGYFQHQFATYDREGEACLTTDCTGKIKREAQNGRSSFFCPKCQK